MITVYAINPSYATPGMYLRAPEGETFPDLDSIQDYIDFVLENSESELLPQEAVQGVGGLTYNLWNCQVIGWTGRGGEIRLEAVTDIYKPWEDENYLGLIALQRQGEKTPVSLHVVRPERGRLGYFEGNGRKVILRSNDRSHSTAVVDDDAPERQDALISALREDRWRNVMLRG